MRLLPRLVHAHLRSPLPGKTRMTLALAARSRPLQEVPIVISGARPLFLDLRDASNHDLFKNSPHAKPPWPWVAVAVLRQVIRSGDVVLDVGANRGLYAASLAAKAGPNGRVICLEPNPALLPQLQCTVAATPWMTVLALALSDTDGSTTLFVPENHEMSSFADCITEGSGRPTRQVSVMTAKLDTLISNATVPRPDVIKIDVEGNELKVLRGSLDLLNREDAPILVYESNVFAAPKVTGEPVTAATSFLLDLERPRYRCFFLWDWGLVTQLNRGQIVHGDILAIPASQADRWPTLIAEGMSEMKEC